MQIKAGNRVAIMPEDKLGEQKVKQAVLEERVNHALAQMQHLAEKMEGIISMQVMIDYNNRVLPGALKDIAELKIIVNDFHHMQADFRDFIAIVRRLDKKDNRQTGFILGISAAFSTVWTMLIWLIDKFT